MDRKIDISRLMEGKLPKPPYKLPLPPMPPPQHIPTHGIVKKKPIIINLTPRIPPIPTPVNGTSSNGTSSNEPVKIVLSPKQSIPLPKIEKKADPLLNMTIFFKSDSRSVIDGKNGKEFSENIKSFQSTDTTCDIKEIDFSLQGHVSEEKFNEAFNIYENNQGIYSSQLDDNCNTDNILLNKEIVNKLNILERWFSMIIEPSPPEGSEEEDYDEWYNREIDKINKGVTEYCSEELLDLITPSFDEEAVKVRKRNLSIVQGIINESYK